MSPATSSTRWSPHLSRPRLKNDLYVAIECGRSSEFSFSHSLEPIAKPRDGDAGETLVDFLEALGCFFPGRRLGREFFDGAENFEALDLSVHVAEDPDVRSARARFAKDTAL